MWSSTVLLYVSILSVLESKEQDRVFLKLSFYHTYRYPWVERSEENGDGHLIYRPAYWHFGHFSRFIPRYRRPLVPVKPHAWFSLYEFSLFHLNTRGSEIVNITSSSAENSTLEFTAAVTPEDYLVVVVLNANDDNATFALSVPKYGQANLQVSSSVVYQVSTVTSAYMSTHLCPRSLTDWIIIPSFPRFFNINFNAGALPKHSYSFYVTPGRGRGIKRTSGGE